MARVATPFGLAFLALAAPLSGCEAPKVTTPVAADAPPSPAASIFPSPLVTLSPAPTDTATAPRALLQPKAGARHREPLAAGSSAPRAVSSVPQTVVPVPLVLRVDEAAVSDLSSGKDGHGVSLAAEWRWEGAGGPPARPEVNLEGIAVLRKQLTPRWTITLSEAGRLRIAFDSRAFPVPAGSELRARADYLGHTFVFPSGTEHRLAPAGSLRSLFADRRLDVAPLVAGEIKARAPTTPRFGAAVERVEMASRTGSIVLELAHVPEAGVGALLLCRTLVELVAIDPRTSVCARDELPVRAQLLWPTGGGSVLEVTELKRRADLPVADTLVPPSGSTSKDGALPAAPSGLLVSREEAQTLRTKPVDLPPPAPRAPSEGLTLRNATDIVRYATVDGVPFAFLLPHSEQAVTGLLRGRYNVQWRSFLGDAVEPSALLEIPGRSAVGEAPEPPPVAAPAKSGK